MKITLTYRDLIYAIIISALLLVIFKMDVSPEPKQDAGYVKLDSVLLSEGLKRKLAADSLVKLVGDKEQQIIILNKNDSIKTFKAKKRAKIKHTDADRKHLTDSIFTISGIRIK